MLKYFAIALTVSTAIVPAHAKLREIPGFHPMTAISGAESKLLGARNESRERLNRNKAANEKREKASKALSDEKKRRANNKRYYKNLEAEYEKERQGFNKVLSEILRKNNAKMVKIRAQADRLNAETDAELDRLEKQGSKPGELAAVRKKVDAFNKLNKEYSRLRRENNKTKEVVSKRREQRVEELARKKAELRQRRGIKRKTFASYFADETAKETNKKLQAALKKERKAALHFLKLLYENPPVHIEKVTVSFNKKTIYAAAYKNTGAGSGAIGDDLTVLNSILQKEKEKLQYMVSARDSLWEFRHKATNKYVTENSQATYSLNEIASSKYREILTLMIVEMSGQIAAAIATGGASTGTSFVLSKAQKIATAASKTLTKQSTRTISKKALKVTARLIIDELSSVPVAYFSKSEMNALGQKLSRINQMLAGPPDAVQEEDGPLRAAATLIAGDIAERVTTDIIGKGTDSIVKYAARKLAGEIVIPPPTSKLEIGTGLAIDVVATGIKAMIVAGETEFRIRERMKYVRAHIRAGVLAGFVDLANRDYQKSLVIVAAQKEAVQALEQRIKHGAQARKLEISSSKKTDLDENDTIKITAHFSASLKFLPKLSAPGLKIIKTTKPRRPHGKLTIPGTKIWEFHAKILDDAPEETVLKFSMSSANNPWSLLDSKPETPAQISSLIDASWKGYEAGKDTNHTIFLKNKPADVALVMGGQFGKKFKYKCTSVKKIHPASKNKDENWLNWTNKTIFFDSVRKKALGQWASGEVLLICLDAAGNPKREKSGMVIAAGSGIARAPQDEFKPYSNGYLDYGAETAQFSLKVRTLVTSGKKIPDKMIQKQVEMFKTLQKEFQ